jgi:hypothetical protein
VDFCEYGTEPSGFIKCREFINQLSDYQLLKKGYWVFGLCPSSGVLETRKRKVSEIGSGCKTLCFLVSRILDDG